MTEFRKIVSLVALGFRNSFRRPLRTGLSIVGIALCIMLMLTVTTVSQRYTTVVGQSYSIYRSEVLVVSKAALLVEGLPLGGAVTEATVGLVKQVTGVTSVTPMLLVVYFNKLVPSNITIGVPIQNFSMFAGVTSVHLQGSYPSTDDQVVVGGYLASTSGLAVGSTFTEGGVSLTVSGIITTSNLILGNAVIMPLETAQSTEGYSGLVSAVLVDSNIQPGPLISSIESSVPGVAAIDPAQSESLTSPLLSSIAAISYAIDAFSAVLAILFVTIIVSVNILEQRDEFATMWAIGASSRSVLKVTLAQTSLMSGAGVVIGLVLSLLSTALVFRQYAGLPVVATISNLSTLFPLATAAWAGIGVIAFGMLVGGISTAAIARKPD